MVPNFWSLMLPTLKALADGEETPLFKIRERVADALGLTPEDLRERVQSGRQPVFNNRVDWCMTCLTHAGLVKRVRRAVYQILPEGTDLLNQDPPCIDRDLLRRYPKYVEWELEIRNRPRRVKAGSHDENGARETPEEELFRVTDELRSILESELLDRIRDSSPGFLEQVAVHLLISMRCGGDAERGYRKGGVGDGGIDGVILEDPLGLDKVFIQAKRFNDKQKVGTDAIANFAGAIDKENMTKGVFVTTSGFTKNAKEFAEGSPKQIALIDGKELVHLMLLHGIGVRKRPPQEIERMAVEAKGVDEDYFTDLDS